MLSLMLLTTFVPPAHASEKVDPAADAAIHEQAKTYESAFNKHDAAALAQLWTNDATYMDASGQVAAGRKQLQRLFSEYFEKNPKESIRIEIQSLEPMDSGIIVERGVTEVVDEHGSAVSTSPYVAVDQLVDGRWMISQANEGVSTAAAHSVQELAWLAGDWQAGDKDNAINMHNQLLGDGHFLVTTFSRPGTAAENELMVTAVDGQSGTLLATTFGANGASGHGVWRHLPDGSWALRLVRRQPDNAIVSGVHVIKPADGNSFHWKTTGRVCNGVPMEDSEDKLVTKVR